MRKRKYKREKAIKYAEKWAYERNPKYYNYDNIGGDCTNFVSQCLYEGSGVMNYSNSNGWYYKNGNNKSASWTGVKYLYQFLINNKLEGPHGSECSVESVQIGDIAQLSFDGTNFGHSLLIVKKEGNDLNKIYIAAHTFNTFGRKISSYEFQKIRFIHIEKVLF